MEPLKQLIKANPQKIMHNEISIKNIIASSSMIQRSILSVSLVNQKPPATESFQKIKGKTATEEVTVPKLARFI
jgi:hypothetical protein